MSLRSKIALYLLGGLKDPKERENVLKEAVKRLFNGITEEDVLRNVDGRWYCEGREITEAEMNQVRAEAAALVNTRLWRVFRLDMRYQINLRMFQEGRDEKDFLWGRLFVFLVDVFETRLKQLAGKF